MTLINDINKLKSYFLSKDGGIMAGEISPDITESYDLGRSDKKWDTIYAKSVIADTIEGGGGGGDADTVDGYDAAGNPLPSNLLALDPQSTFPTSVYPSAILKDGSRALEGSLTVVSGATIDGVDIGIHAHTGVGDHGVALTHANLTDMDADDHPHYTQRAQDEIITGDWMFTHLQDRSAGWQFLPNDKIFKAIPHNMIFAADISKASISIGALVSTEYAIHIYDDDTPTTYLKVGRGDDSITLHGTDSTYKLWAGAAAAGSAPFRVENDGSIFASAGEIAGWDIDATTISKNSMTLNSVGRIIAGTGNELIQIDAADPTWRLWIGHATAASAPFRVNKVGQMYMYDAFVTGTLKSTNFISGQSGFSLDSSGLAEFQQIIARGRLEATVFAEAAISVASGKMIISDGAVVAVDIADTDDYIIVDTDVFQQNDIVRVKPDASRDEWMRITSPYTIVAEGFKYYVARGLNDTEPTWVGPYDFYAGESVVRLGSAQQTNVGYPLSAGEAGGEYGEFQAGGSGATTGGGYLILEGSRNLGPFFGVAARYGPVYDQIVDVVRIGNLNGISDYTVESWGVFFGDDNQYFSYDQTDGVQIEFSGADVDSTIDKSGMKSERFRFAKTTADPSYVNYEALMYYKVVGGNNQIKVRLKEDAIEEEYIISGLAVKTGIPTPTPDDIEVLFTTPGAEPYVPSSIMVYIQGIAQKPGTDFTETNPAVGTFTMTTAPTTGVTMVVQYGVNTSADYSLSQTDHGQLTGMGDNDHIQYLLKDGTGNYMTGALKNFSGDFQIESASGTFTLPGTNVTFTLDATTAAYFVADGDGAWSGLVLKDAGVEHWHIGERGDADLHIHRSGGTGIIHFNDAGSDVDVRMKGDTDEWLFFLDAGLDLLNFQDVAFHTYFDIEDQTAPGTPASGYGRVYVNSDDLLFKDDGGNVSRLSGRDSKNVTIGNGADVITIGDKMYFRLNEATRLERYTLLADASGDLVVVLKKIAYASYPGSWSTVATMTLSAAQKIEVTTGWDLDADYVYKLEVTGTPATITLCGVEMVMRFI